LSREVEIKPSQRFDGRQGRLFPKSNPDNELKPQGQSRKQKCGQEMVLQKLRLEVEQEL